MRRPKSRSRKLTKARLDRLGYVGLSIAVLLIVGLGIAYCRLAASQVRYDAETFCPEKGPTAITAMLIDRTDPLTPVQQENLRNELDAVRAGIPRYGSLELYTVGPTDESVLQREAKLCNPGRGSEVNPLIGNPRLVEARWQNGFAEPLQSVFDNMLPPGTAPTSPIMESIQSVAATAFGESEPRDRPKRLLIVSDMLQHVDAYSHYREPPEFDKFRRTSYYRTVRADLRGVEVEILYVYRETKSGMQGKDHITFWQQYISDQGGILTRVKALPG